MLPGAGRGMSLWCALLVNASTRPLPIVFASTARRLPPAAAFVGGGSTSSLAASKGAFPTRASLPISSSSCSSSFSTPCNFQRLPQHSRWLRSPQQESARRVRGGRIARSISSGTAVASESGEACRRASVDDVSSGVTSNRDGSAPADETVAAVDAAHVGGGGKMKVTLLSGFLGAGKTTLMRNVMRQAAEERLSLAVIVNDMADVNIDSQLLARNGLEVEQAVGEAMAGADVRSVGNKQQQQQQLSRDGSNRASVAMQDGCICCTLRGDLLFQVEAFARERKYQHLIIESTGISDPNPVAEALAISDYNGDYINDGDFDGSADHAVGDKVIRATAADGRDGGLASTEGTGEGLFSLDTLVTVVDATSFLDEVRKADDLEDRGLEAQEGDTRTIADLLVSQVEFANVILLNKADMANEGDMTTLETLVRRLNPAARVLRTVSSDVGLAQVVGTGEFDLDEASQAAGWMQALNEKPEPAVHEDHDHGNHHPPEHDCGGGGCCDDDAHTSAAATTGGCCDGDAHTTIGGCCDDDAGTSAAATVGAQSVRRREETFGIGSFTFRSRRPFHPERLFEFVMEQLPSVLRSKGFLWLATRHGTAGVWNQAGGSFAVEYGGLWDEDDHSDHAQTREQEDFADANTRRNELVFIGLGMDEGFLTAELRRCLLTEEEMAGGPANWKRLSDPFPPWEEEDFAGR